MTLFADGSRLDRTNPALETTTELTALLRFRVSETGQAVKLVIVIRDGAEVPIRTFPVLNENGNDAEFEAGEHLIEVLLGSVELNAGRYKFVVWLQENTTGVITSRVADLQPFKVYREQFLEHWSFSAKGSTRFAETR